MLKKALIVIFVFLLLINNVDLEVYADTDNEYDYEELYNYDGFGKTMYETVYRETTYLMGEHTNNKEYVEKTIDQVGEYANYLFDQIYGREDNCGQGWSTAGECLKGLFTNYSAGVITIGDYLYKLLKGFWEEEDMLELPDDGWIIRTSGDYLVEVNSLKGYGTSLGCHGLYVTYYGSSNSTRLEVVGGWGMQCAVKYVDGKVSLPTTLLDFNTLLRTYFDGAYLTYKNQPIFNQNPLKLEIGNALRDFSRNRGTIKIPQPIPNLGCSANEIILEIRNGSEFYDKNGNKVDVAYNGKAVYNGEECKLTWIVPNMYYDKDGLPVIEDADGKKKHIETDGEVYTPPTTEKCDKNVFCYLTKLLDSFVNFFDSLTDWFMKVFIPEDTSFISDSLNNLQNKFEEKIEVLNIVKDTLTSGLEETDENILKDIELRLPILNNKPIQFINFDYVNPFIHYAKNFLSGVIVLYTIIHVYRKITGSGGVMEK